MKDEGEYYHVERLTLKGWTEVKPWEVRTGNIFRMFYTPTKNSQIKGVAGESTWLATSEPFRNIMLTDGRTRTWSIVTQRLSPYREVFWRMKRILGLFDDEIEA